MYKLSSGSRTKLVGVNADLVMVMERAIAITTIDFSVIEGLRTVERQVQLVAAGASRTMNSRHITGHAVDIAPWIDGELRWDWPLYYQLATIVKSAARDCRVGVEWGGDWKTFKDGPHWQLPRKTHP